MRVTILKLLRGSQTNRFKLYCTISLMFTQSVSVALYSRDTRSFQRFLTVAKLQRDTWMPNIRPEKPGLWNSPLELHDGQWQQDEDRAWTGPWCREKRWRGEPDTEPGGRSHKSPASQLEALDKHTNICKTKCQKLSLLFKRFGSVRFFRFLKNSLYAHLGCIYLIKNTVKH